MTAKQRDLLARIEKNQRDRRRARHKLAYENQLLDILIVEGVRHGIPKKELGKRAGLSGSQLYRRTGRQGA